MYAMCFCCTKRCAKKNTHKHKMFMTSYDKLLEEMDVVEFVRNMRYLKVLLKVLFN
jgi:hypothetical protein